MQEFEHSNSTIRVRTGGKNSQNGLHTKDNNHITEYVTRARKGLTKGNTNEKMNEYDSQAKPLLGHDYVTVALIKDHKFINSV